MMRELGPAPEIPLLFPSRANEAGVFVLVEVALDSCAMFSDWQGECVARVNERNCGKHSEPDGEGHTDYSFDIGLARQVPDRARVPVCSTFSMFRYFAFLLPSLLLLWACPLEGTRWKPD